MFYTTFNKISMISWRSVLLMEETGVPMGKAPTCRKSLTNLSHYVVSSTLPMSGIRTVLTRGVFGP